MRVRFCQLVALVTLALGALSLRPLGAGAAQATAGTIAYVRADSLDEIRLINPDGQQDRRLWAHGRADPQNVYAINNLEWRRDGAELAFASTHENWCSLNHADIFVVGSSGGGYRRITEAPACAALAGYAKGTVQLPVRNSGFDSFVGFVYLQGAPSAQQVALPPGGSGLVTFANVADFGSGALQVAVLIQGAQRAIDVGTAVDVQPGATVRAGTMDLFPLGSYDVWEAHSPTWRGDGAEIGYILNYDGLRRISANPAPLDFGAALQTDQAQMPDFADLLAWGPPARSGQLLYAGNTAFESEAIYLINAGSATAGQPLVSYEPYQNIRGLAWLPDGTGFVYSVAEEYGDTRANIYLYTFASGTATPVTAFADDFAGQLSVSPDGQSIVFERSATAEIDAATELWIVGRNGGGLRRLAQNAARPSWSAVAVAVLDKRVSLPHIMK